MGTMAKETANEDTIEKMIALDEDFISWWAEGLEREGCNLDKDTIRIATQQEKPFLFRNYTYREYFDAMRRGEYWPSVTYNLAYTMCWKSVLENMVEDEGAAVPPWKRPRE